jgi:hypothetical protein
MKFKRLQWAGHTDRMDNSRIPKKVLDGKFHGRRPVGRQHQEGLIVAAEHKRMEGMGRG